MKHILFYALFFILKIASAQAQSLDQPKNYPADAISSFAERLEPMDASWKTIIIMCGVVHQL